jgi:hypothetical protein
MSLDSFKTRTTIAVGRDSFDLFSLPALERAGFSGVSRLPFSLKILLENLLRREDNAFVHADDIRALASWTPKAIGEKEISFMPARVLLQDFTGVPCVVDLAAMRDGIAQLGGDPQKVNPLQPVELVIDHSVQVDHFGRSDSLKLNADLEYHRNRERYVFLRWGQTAFNNFVSFRRKPASSIRSTSSTWRALSAARRSPAERSRIPTRSSAPTRIRRWSTGSAWLAGASAASRRKAAMLGQPSSMLIPAVVGYRLHGKLPEGATATDLVLTITEALRKKGVVGTFVEFYGPGLKHLTIADRVTLGNMCPEYGATVAIFPIDEMTLEYLRFTGRDPAQVALVEAYARRRAFSGPTTRQTRSTPIRSNWISPRWCRVLLALVVHRTGSRCRMRSRRSRRRCPTCRKRSRSPRPRPVAAARRSPKRWHTARARLSRDRRDHELHEHVEPERDDRRRAGRQARRREGPDVEAVGEDEPRARLQGRDRVSGQSESADVSSISSGSTSSATAAPRASATAVRCPTRSPLKSAIAGWSCARCCPATATSRAAFSRTSARTTWRRRRWWWPMRWPDR